MATLAEKWIGKGNIALGSEGAKLEQAFRTLYEAYLDGPFERAPGQLLADLKELDAATLQDLIFQLEYEQIGTLRGTGATSQERELAIRQAEQLYRHSPLAQWAVVSWTGWGLGDRVTVKLSDEKAQAVWDEFYNAERNAALFAEDKIHEMSNWLLVKGDRFFTCYASDIDGEMEISSILPEEIEGEPLTDPGNSKDPWFYRRVWAPTGKTRQTAYYPSWTTYFSGKLEERWDLLMENGSVPKNSVRADRMSSRIVPLGSKKEVAGTTVCMMHAAHNLKDESSLRGWPLFTTAAPWLKAHKRFMESRLGVAVAKAMYVRRYSVAGGTRQVRSVLDTIASTLSATNFVERNPAAVAGSSEVHNRAMDVTDVPLSTGASDAQVDNEMFTWMGLLGMSLFPTSAGLDTARWATALEMDKAQSMVFARYQTFWAAQFRTFAKIALLFKEKYTNVTFEDKTAEVSTDTFSLADFPSVAKTIGKLVADMMPQMTEAGVPANTTRQLLASLWRINLQALGIEAANEMTDDDAFAVEEEGEAAEGSSVALVVGIALENYRAGKITADQVVEFAMTELVEARFQYPRTDRIG